MKSTTWKMGLCGRYAAVASLAVAFSLVPIAHAQTFRVTHTFTGGPDGASPGTGLTADRGGNLYGTAGAGTGNAGTVYRLKRSGANWIFELLYAFSGSPDGSDPHGRVTFGPDGALYGTTNLGGTEFKCVLQGGGPGCGTIFRLTPRATICTTISCPWTERVLYRFQGGSDGAFPSGDLTIDQQGNIYGTTTEGGVTSGQCGNGFYSDGCGTVYELARFADSWTHAVVYAFQGPNDNYADGVGPESGVILDNGGNLYGTTPFGGVGGVHGSGVIFKLSPSGNDWIQSVLYRFVNGSDGAYPWGGLIRDVAGNLYGTVTVGGGPNYGGTVFELTPSDGAWNFSLLYSFLGLGYGGPGHSDPSLTMDASGNLYGAWTAGGAHGYGSIFKLSPSNDGWVYTSLHDFTCGSDGGLPISNVLLDSDGNLHGTTGWGGDASCFPGHGHGVVWEITPN